MKTRTYTSATPGPLLLDLRLPAGSVRVVVDDFERAEVQLTGPAEWVDSAWSDDLGDRLRVGVSGPPASAVSGVSMTVTGGNVGMVVGTVYGGMHMHGANFGIGRGGGMVIGSLAPAGGVDALVRLPLGSSLVAETVSAPVSSTGGLVTADVHTTSGAIHLATVAGTRLHTVSGTVTIDALIGDGSIETVSGGITVAADVPCDVSARSVSGDIRATGPIRLDAHTVSGRIRNY